MDSEELPVARYTTDGIPPRERFDYWREMAYPVAEIAYRDPADRGCAFSGVAAAYHLGSMLVHVVREDAKITRRTAGMIRATGLDHWMIILTRAGEFCCRTGDRVVSYGPGSMAVLSMAEVFDGISVDWEGSVFYVPRDALPLGAADPRALHNSALQGGLFPLLGDYLRGLESGLPAIATASLPGITAATAGLLSACFAPGRDSVAAAETAISLTLLKRAKDHIRANLTSPTLSIEELCGVTGLSRSSLFRLFHDQGGIAAYIREQRLLAAHKALSDRALHRPLKEIWSAYRFSAAGDFSRAFKKQFGYSPSDVRPRLPFHPASIAAAGSSTAGHILADWLARLRD